MKLSGDGTNIGKRIHVVNISFTVLEEGRNAMSSDGNHTVAILDLQEDYENLKLSLQDIINEVKNLKKITVDGHTFTIEWFLGGDWKFLACVVGIGGAIADNPCIWCKCFLYNNYDFDAEYSLLDSEKASKFKTIQEKI